MAENTGNKDDRSAGRRRIGAGIIVFLSMAMGLFFVSIVKDNLALAERDVAFGATFSTKYAEQLGLDWREAYAAMLDDLGVKKLRIPAYWDDIEPEPGTFDFSDVDWQVRQAASRGATVILAVGMKLPRWPECHIPEWAKALDDGARMERTIEMLRAVVAHFAKEPAVVAWQVENEPLFDFGECPPPDRDALKREIAEVRAMDDRPIIVTESGELSTWVRTASLADILGISTYRSVWNRYVGYFYWPVTPLYYSKRAAAISTLVDRIIITELQAEPWAPGPITDLDIEHQLGFMNPRELEKNLSFVRRAGFPEVYLWGVEWWYWLKEKGHPEMWQAADRVFHGGRAMP